LQRAEDELDAGQIVAHADGERGNTTVGDLLGVEAE
jgi:hypothetical protein